VGSLRPILAAFALTGGLSSSAAAQADQATAMTCAVLYDEFLYEFRDIALDYTAITAQNRALDLTERFALDREAKGLQRVFLLSEIFDLTPEQVLQPAIGLALPERVVTDADLRDDVTERLATCDRTFGFSPVFALDTGAAPLPEGAAYDTRPHVCAALFSSVQSERDFRGDAQDQPFWAHSNAAAIDHQARYDSLQRRTGMTDITFSNRVFEVMLEGLPRPSDDGAGFVNLGPDAEVPDYGQWLTACDLDHGFDPVFHYGTQDAPAVAPGHFHCAAAYWLYGAAQQTAQETAFARADQATRLYQGRFPDLDLDQIVAEVIAQGQARAQTLEADATEADRLLAELTICEQTYAPALLGIALSLGALPALADLDETDLDCAARYLVVEIGDSAYRDKTRYRILTILAMYEGRLRTPEETVHPLEDDALMGAMLDRVELQVAPMLDAEGDAALVPLFDDLLQQIHDCDAIYGFDPFPVFWTE